MKKLLLQAAGLFIASIAARAQIDPVFQNLNFSSCNTGYFWTQTSGDGRPPDGTTYATVDQAGAASVLFNLRKADITPAQTIVPDYNQLRTQWNSAKNATGVIPIAIAEFNIQEISPAAVTNGWIYATSNGLFQQPSQTNIFQTYRTLTLYVDEPVYKRGEMKFRLDPAHYFQNVGSMPSQIRIDFGDGSGWKTITPGATITVNYSNVTGERHLKLDVVRGSQVWKSGLKMGADQCLSNFEDPDIHVPWPVTGNPVLPWEISTQVDGTTVSGNAYYLPSGAFDKPFIFVEGIDFGYNCSSTQNGTFGWCEFTSGISDQNYSYAMLHRMPELLNKVRENGYDIILLDFRDGATWIQHNSMLLVKLIQMVNATKTGDNPLVVAGASMGGQISRYALRWMEKQGLEHCTRLWISLDSPHKGAHIPLSLQQILHGLAEFSSDASAFVNDYLNRPAARQLLNIQFQSLPNIYSPPTRNEWYQLLDGMGFPEHCRTVGIANGNMRSATQGYGHNSPHLNYKCEANSLLFGPEAKYYLMPTQGDSFFIDSWGNTSQPNSSVTAQLVYTRFNNTSTLGSLFSVLGIDVQKIVKTYRGNPANYNFDNAPGGYRRSMVDFVRSVNSKLQGTTCELIQEYAPKHCFIPTASALAIDTNDPYANIETLLLSNPSLCPFDRYHAPLVSNEAHSEVSSDNLQIVLSEILGGETTTGQPLLPTVLTSAFTNNGDFNYGKAGYAQIPSVTIGAGGLIAINKNIPTHFAQSSDVLPTTPHFKVKTYSDCDASIINIENLGVLEIGDPVQPKTGELVIGKKAVININSSGTLRINPGSKLIIADGGILRVKPGGLLRVEGGEIIVRRGGMLIYEGGNFQLNRSQAALRLRGGQLHIAPNVTLSFTHPGESGFVEIGSEAEQELFTSSGSVLKISGDGPGDVMLKITDWANLWNGNFSQGQINLENCMVQLDNNGQFWTDMKLNATNVTFSDAAATAGQSTAHVWYNYATLTNCKFKNVKLKGQDTRFNITGSVFEGQHSGLQATSGYYKIITTDFVDCGIESASLENPSSVISSRFYLTHPSHTYRLGIRDQSLAKLTVDNSLFTGAFEAIEKSSGTLALACNQFILNDIAVTATSGCLVSMNSQSSTGYNLFNGNNQNILLNNAGGLNLYRGYNQLAGYNDMNITGTIAGIPCPDDCTYPIIDAQSNIWSTDGTAQLPDPESIDIRSGSYSMACSTPNTYYFCPLRLTDHQPAVTTACQAYKTPPSLIKTQKSATYLGDNSLHALQETGETLPPLKTGDEDLDNPLLYTEYFQGIRLDSALVVAVTKMEFFDETQDDALAVAMLHDILTSGLDRTNPEIRWKMIWGREYMKAAFEEMVTDGEIELLTPGSDFDFPTSRYVDVLNLMTDTMLTDSTYRSQFYLELDKGQLYRTLGRTDIAREIFIHLGDCQLDSLEQEVLNDWRAQAEMELALQEQYIHEGLSPGQVVSEVDTTTYTLPVSYVADAYYFGLIIQGPEDLSFMSCGNMFPKKERRMSGNTGDYTLFPNPADETVYLKSSDLWGVRQAEIMDTWGRTIVSLPLEISPETPVEVPLPPDLAAGTYVFRLHTPHGNREKLLLIR